MTKTFKFPIITSTSDKAKELLEKGETTPFYVVAETQTAGRGSYSNSWESPKGNLYITAITDYKQSKQDMLPLKIGVILAEWIRENFSLNVKIKWPNDIIFSGEKLAGILCEMHSINSKKYLSLGIGLNLFTAPNFESSSSYKASSLNNKQKSIKDLEGLTQSFLSTLDKEIEKLHSQVLIKKLPTFLIKNESLWQHKTNKSLFINKGLDENGYLKLQTLEKKETITVGSHNEYTWYFQNNNIYPKPLGIIEKKENQFKISYFNDFREKKITENIFCEKTDLDIKLMELVKSENNKRAFPLVLEEPLNCFKNLSHQYKIELLDHKEKSRLMTKITKDLPFKTILLIEGYFSQQPTDKERVYENLVFLEKNRLSQIVMINSRMNRIESKSYKNISDYQKIVDSFKDNKEKTLFITDNKSLLELLNYNQKVYTNKDLSTLGIKTLISNGC